jgi:hypothetical protein
MYLKIGNFDEGGVWYDNIRVAIKETDCDDRRRIYWTEVTAEWRVLMLAMLNI